MTGAIQDEEDDGCGGTEPKTGFKQSLDSVSATVENCLKKCLPTGGLGAVSGDFGAYRRCLIECFALVIGEGALRGEKLVERLKQNPKMKEILEKLDEMQKAFGDRIRDAVKRAGFDLSKAFATEEEINLRRALSDTFTTGAKKSIEAQAKLNRWKFIDQLPPEAKKALVEALKAAGVPIPEHLAR
jgi:hypothetical protein